MAFLKDYGYSDQMIERFFVPFFRGVFLEGELKTNSTFFKFLYGQFAKGDVVVPENGMQAIPEQIASHLSPDQIRFDTTVDKIEKGTVYLKNGETIEADKIVLATDANAAAKLLGSEPNIEFNGTSCMYFESDVPLETEGKPYLMINSNTNELIDHVFPVSDIAPSYAPAGKTLISVNIVGNKEVSEENVQAELDEWFDKKHVWQHLKTYKIPEALPQYFEGSPVKIDLRIDDNTFRCGDYTAYPSLNGAMKTGREVAEMIIAQTAGS
jgi:protoporphyrinogen oxidase